MINIQEKQSPFLYSVFPLFLIGLIWFAYIVANQIIKPHEILAWSGITKLIIDNGTILILALSFFMLWRKAERRSVARMVFASFAIAHGSLFIAANVYNGIYNVLYLPHSDVTWFWSSLDDIFFTSYLLFGFLSLVLILSSIKINVKKFIVIYIPIVLIVCALAIISFYNIKWNIASSSLISTSYNLAEKILEMVCIIAAALCVATTKNKGIFYISLGILIDIVIEMILAFKVFAQGYGVGSIFENGWILGDLLIIYGLIVLAKSKNLSNAREWLVPPDTIRAQSAYWLFIVSLAISTLTVLTAKVVGQVELNNQWLPFLPVILLVCVIFAAIFSNIAARKLTRPFLKLQGVLDFFLTSERDVDSILTEKRFNGSINLEYKIVEFRKLQDFLIKAFSALKDKAEAEKNLYELAIQTAHDIRSPIAAIQSAVLELKDTNTAPYKAICSASDRIINIADDLIERYKNQGMKFAPKQLTSELIYSLIDNVIAEKKTQFKKDKIKIKLTIKNNAQGIFCKVEPVAFKATISNLINNAVESIIKVHGNIEISINNTEINQLIIEIIDNGKGFSEATLVKLKEKNLDQLAGIEIGLRSAITNINAWGGSHDVVSRSGVSNRFTISLPKAEPPDWFCKDVAINPNTNVVIVSSDSAIRDILDRRLHRQIDSGDEIYLVECRAFNEISLYLKKKIMRKMRNNLYLADFDLFTTRGDGLEIIEQFGIAKDTILIANDESPNFRKRCLALGLKIIPKNYMQFVPIVNRF